MTESSNTGIGGHVAIMRALNGLGDFLCLTPALRALRAVPDVERISLVTADDTARMVLPRFAGLVDDILPFPGFPGIVEHPFAPERLAAFLRDEARSRLDWALQMHGDGSVSNSFVAMLGAARIGGYQLPGLWNPDPRGFFAYPADLPEPVRWRALVERLGAPPRGDQLDLPIAADERAEARALTGAAPNRYAVLHVGASTPARTWPADCFAAIGDLLARRGLQVVLTGTAQERERVAHVQAAMRADAIDLAGRTTLGTLAALVEGARLVVCNDTGVSHVAAATRTPSVVIFIASDRARWAPLDGRLHRAVGTGVPDPRVGVPAAAIEPPFPAVEEVAAAVAAQLADAPARAA